MADKTKPHKFLPTVIFSAMFLAVGCSGNSGDSGNGSAESGTVNLMSYSGIFEDRYTEAVIEGFEDKYPDIDVNFVAEQTSASMLGTVRSESGSPRNDVVIADTSVADAAIAENLFAPLDNSEVPNIENVVASGQNEDGYGPAVTFDSLTLIYDTERITDQPDTWEFLWETNDLAISAPPNIQGHALTVITSEMLGEDYTEDVSPAISELSDLAPNVATWEPQPDAFQAIIQETHLAGTGWNARAQTFNDDSDGKLGVAIPSEGTVSQINTINLVEGAPNEEAAKTFINYALSAEAQEAFAENMYYAPTVEDAELSSEVEARVADPEADVIDLDWQWMTENQDEWTELWRRNVIR